MIDPPKATKGRRMSKKTRKKSPKPSSRKAPRARSKAATKKQPSTISRASAKKPGNNATKQSGNATSGASHKAPSKQLTKTSSSAAGKNALTEGAMAPPFPPPPAGGDTLSLSDSAGQKLWLFFYSPAGTPGVAH